MKIRVVVHEAEEGGYWAEVPAIPGCGTQGETFEELLQNLYEAVEACLSFDALSCHTEPIVFVIEDDPRSKSPEFLRLMQVAREEIECGDFITLDETKRQLS